MSPRFTSEGGVQVRQFRGSGSSGRFRRMPVPARRALLSLPLVAFGASCVQVPRTSSAPPPAAGPAAALQDPTDLVPLSQEQALAANAALPVAGPQPGVAAPFLLRAAGPVDRLRSLECLAQAVYYEARSESEQGQRAVAQVVLNRVRHSAYPASVCGVVYQGPMRAGGGCQFTFTCDGSLAAPPAGPAWQAARRIAADALAGYVEPTVGNATHYHTLSVFPHWAPTLVKAAMVGSHVFYRFPGAAGEPAAFRQAHAGHEPLPVPRRILFDRPDAPAQAAALALPGGPEIPAAATAVDPLLAVDQGHSRLPESGVREAWRHSGRVRSEPLSRPAPQLAYAFEDPTVAGEPSPATPRPALR